MKISVDYENLHVVIEKFENGDQLTEEEKQDLLIIIKAAEEDYYPSKEELEFQKLTVERLEKMDVNRHRDTFDKLINLCIEFENKYL